MPLADRLFALQGVRFVLAAVVVAAAVVAPDVAGAPEIDLRVLSAVYVAATASAEALRRALRRRALPLVSAMLLVDGLFLAAVVAETGGVSSHFLFLVHLHVVAAALLASFRSGIVIAGWHALLLVAAEHAAWVGGPPARPTIEHAVVAGSFVLVAVTAVSVARLNERALRRSRRAATALVELGSGLEVCRTGAEVTWVASQQLTAGLGYRRAAVLLVDGDHWRGAVADAAGPVSLTVPRRGIDVRRDGEAPEGDDVGPVLVDHLDPVVHAALATVLPGACHVIVVPLRSEGRLVGSAAVECGPGRSVVRDEDLALVTSAIDRVTLSARTVCLLAQVERLATSDALTSLANRRLFDTTLQREVARARRTGAPLSLAVVDVDHFKDVNDRHGHQAGDEVLRQLAAELRSAVRGEDLVARFGGEEFVVLMADATGDDAVVVGERLRAAARNVEALPVTVSVGIATLPSDGDADALIAAADAALYRAKAGGRDRTVRHDAGNDRVPQIV